MVLPLSKPFTCLDGTDAKELFLPEGTIIFASILGSNRNPELWGSDSHEWKPERWLSPLPAELTNAGIPGVYSHLYVIQFDDKAESLTPLQDDLYWRESVLHVSPFLSRRTKMSRTFAAVDSNLPN